MTPKKGIRGIGRAEEDFQWNNECFSTFNKLRRAEGWKKKKKKIARSTPVPKSEKGGGIFAIPWKTTSRENTANYIGSRPKRSLVENIFESFLRGWYAVSCLYWKFACNSPLRRKPGSNPRSILSTVHDYWNGMEFGEGVGKWMDRYVFLFFSFLFYYQVRIKWYIDLIRLEHFMAGRDFKTHLNKIIKNL